MTFAESISRGYVKRGAFIIRNRCLDFIEPLRKAGIKELPIEQAIDTFGVHDRATVKAYFGTLPGRSTRMIRQTAHYASGTLSMKSIHLEQDIPRTRGYLEKLGLVHYEKRGSHWFMILETALLVPTLKKKSESPCETSLSHSIGFLQGKGMGETVLEVSPTNVTNDVDGENNNTHYRVRERNQSSESEQRCIDCGIIDSSNPYRVSCPKGQGLRSRSDVCVLESSA